LKFGVRQLGDLLVPHAVEELHPAPHHLTLPLEPVLDKFYPLVSAFKCGFYILGKKISFNELFDHFCAMSFVKQVLGLEG
jgi:hypothetical protein